MTDPNTNRTKRPTPADIERTVRRILNAQHVENEGEKP